MKTFRDEKVDLPGEWFLEPAAGAWGIGEDNPGGLRKGPPGPDYSRTSIASVPLGDVVQVNNVGYRINGLPTPALPVFNPMDYPDIPSHGKIVVGGTPYVGTSLVSSLTKCPDQVMSGRERLGGEGRSPDEQAPPRPRKALSDQRRRAKPSLLRDANAELTKLSGPSLRAASSFVQEPRDGRFDSRLNVSSLTGEHELREVMQRTGGGASRGAKQNWGVKEIGADAYGVIREPNTANARRNGAAERGVVAGSMVSDDGAGAREVAGGVAIGRRTNDLYSVASDVPGDMRLSDCAGGPRRMGYTAGAI
jgi:hypothetical protein